MSKLFGDYIRSKRENLRQEDPAYSIRKVAGRIGVHHSYLSKIERGELASLSEKRMAALADELGVDFELLMAMNGKIPEEVRRLVFNAPEDFLDMLKQFKENCNGDCAD